MQNLDQAVLHDFQNIYRHYEREIPETIYNSPLYRGLRLWDSLPENIQKETDKAPFKKRIATHPLEDCIGGL